MDIGEIRQNEVDLLRQHYASLPDDSPEWGSYFIPDISKMAKNHELVSFNQLFYDIEFDEGWSRTVCEEARKSDLPEAAWILQLLNNSPPITCKADFVSILADASDHKGYAAYYTYLCTDDESSLDEACEADLILAWSAYQRQAFEDGADDTTIYMCLLDDGDIDAFYVLGRTLLNATSKQDHKAGSMYLRVAAAFGHRCAAIEYLKTLSPNELDYYRWLGYVYTDDVKYNTGSCVEICHPKWMDNKRGCYELGKVLYQNDVTNYDYDEDNALACIDFFLTQYESYQKAVFTWMLCAPKLGIYYDVSRMIAQKIWESRHEPIMDFSYSDED